MPIHCFKEKLGCVDNVWSQLMSPVLHVCSSHTPEAPSEASGGHASVFYWARTGKSQSRIFSVSLPFPGRPLSLGGSVEPQSPATWRHSFCQAPRTVQLTGRWAQKHRVYVCVCVGALQSMTGSNKWMNNSFKSHLTEQRALSRTALICSSCPWSWLWAQRSCGPGSRAASLVRMFTYSEGGVMATNALEAITRTLYMGLADSWSKGGRKSDNVLAERNQRSLSSNIQCGEK